MAIQNNKRLAISVLHGAWGGSPKGFQGAVAPLFSPFPKGEGGLGVGGYNNPSGASNPVLTQTNPAVRRDLVFADLICVLVLVIKRII